MTNTFRLTGQTEENFPGQNLISIKCILKTASCYLYKKIDMETIDPAPRNEHLWNMALRRAAFKKHAFIYFVVIGFLWVLWYFTSGFGSYPWPIWATGGWGIALMLHYWSAHRDDAGDVKNEYDKLVEEHRRAGKL